jgi:hypothetical protein
VTYASRVNTFQRLVLCLFLCACASKSGAPPATPAPPAAEPSSEGAGEPALRPFTAEQIRAATKPGRTYEFKLEALGQPAMLVHIEFVEATAEGAVTESTTFDAAGAPLGAPERGTATWDELVQHASYPKASTVISEDDVEVPAGKFHCALYTVSEGDTLTRVYFAKELPGAPVLLVSEKDGKAVKTMTLMRHVAGG